MSSVSSSASREIMWNIPQSFKILMYSLLVISTIVLLQGLYKKLLFVTGGKGIKSIKGEEGLLPKKLNWSNFFQTLFFTGKVTRKSYVGFFHSLIYYGFIILWIATDLVAIHYDTPFKVFHGTVYIVVSFLADIAGVAILIGLGFAYYRRYVKNPETLSATKPKSELFMYWLIGSLVVIGFLIEGIRIYATGMPIGEKTWAPIGYFIAFLFSNIKLSEHTWSAVYQGLWLIHMVSTMGFIASLGHTKFFHIIGIPLSALLTPQRRGAILNPMDFENEEAETFGLGKISEMTMKNRYDLLTCVECGRCTEVCPANLSGKNLDPKTIITKARDFSLSVKESGKNDADFWEESPLYQANELDACTTCGACMEECPSNIEHVNIILEAKRYKTLTLGEIPPSAGDTVSKIKLNGNPWGITQDDRFKWAEGLDVPVIEEGKKVDYLYYVGCAGSYDAANQKVVQDTIMLLKKAGVQFAVLGKTEKCNGDPIRRFGDEYSFFEVAIENIANLNQYQFDKVVTHCPHCLHTIGKEYAKFEDGQFETIHHTELLSDLIDTGKLKPNKEIKEELTFHDPCYLGRHHGEYNAPRKILNSIKGIKIKEMDANKDKALCCGMGGGNMWYELPEGEHIAKNRLRQIGEKKVEKLATGCSYCMINFNSTKAQVTETENIEVEDVASILAKSLD
ncbi:heterodisulfide reductase-related iron-sulfur binding cluster [Bacteriovoracales bacterium]|nr:heterodisulfide reductase-related iron-sulfur binding cluster [Bacteriovoracales bacterium]